MHSPRLVVVDIGAAHVTCGVFTVGPACRLVLQQLAIEPYSSDPAHESRGAIVLAQALREIVSRHRLRGDAAIAVPGYLTLIKFIKTASVVKEKRGKILAFEVSDNIPYPLVDVVWDYLVVSDDGIDLEVMLTAAKSEAMQTLCAAADSAGFPVRRAIPAGVALRAGFRYNYPEVKESVVLIDIGARSTGMLFIEGERFYLRTLAAAGNLVTQAIAEELRLDFTAAENLKVQVLGGRSDLAPTAPARLSVQRASAAFVARLQIEISRSSINYRGQTGAAAPTALYLTGRGALIPDLASMLAEKSKLPVESYNPLRRVDLSAKARAAGAEGMVPMLSNLVGLASQRVVPAAAEMSLLPAPLTLALAVQNRQRMFRAAAVLVVLALAPPLAYLHQRARATEEQVEHLADLLLPLRSLQSRNAQNATHVEEMVQRVTVLRGAYEARKNWISFFAELQVRLGQIEDVWLDKLAVARPSLSSLQQAAAFARSDAEAVRATTKATPVAAVGTEVTASSVSSVAPLPLRLILSGRLLDVRNPQSKVSPESLQRVKQLLAGFVGSPFITGVESERFDSTQNGLLRFDFTLVINPENTL